MDLKDTRADPWYFAKENMSKNNDIVVELLICDGSGIKLPQHAQKTLSLAERQRLEAMAHPRQASLFLLGRFLLRHWLGRRLEQDPAGIDIRIDAGGKPAPADPDWHFSISHSGDWLALALARGAEIGLDLECRQLDPPRIQRLARRYFSRAEQHWLAQSPDPAQDFLRLWTVKEAVLKAEGGGIANNLQRVRWRPGNTRARLEHSTYRLYPFAPAPARLTLAVAGSPAGRPRLCRAEDLYAGLEITGPQPNLSINP